MHRKSLTTADFTGLHKLAVWRSSPSHHWHCKLFCFVLTQVPLISHSTRSAKLPFFKKATAVIMIVDLLWNWGHLFTTNWVFEKCSFPNLPQRNVQKWRGTFSEAYSIWMGRVFHSPLLLTPPSLSSFSLFLPLFFSTPDCLLPLCSTATALPSRNGNNKGSSEGV